MMKAIQSATISNVSAPEAATIQRGGEARQLRFIARHELKQVDKEEQ
jgi:hypothetical protein